MINFNVLGMFLCRGHMFQCILTTQFKYIHQLMQDCSLKVPYHAKTDFQNPGHFRLGLLFYKPCKLSTRVLTAMSDGVWSWNWMYFLQDREKRGFSTVVVLLLSVADCFFFVCLDALRMWVIVKQVPRNIVLFDRLCYYQKSWLMNNKM